MEGIADILSIIYSMMLKSMWYEEGIQRLQQRMPINPDWFTAPHVLILNAAPGLGKTSALVAAAEHMWETLPVLHLGPTHDSFSNVERREGWSHWQGHDDR